MTLLARLVSVLVLLGAWQAAAAQAGSRLLPAPLAVADVSFTPATYTSTALPGN